MTIEKEPKGDLDSLLKHKIQNKSKNIFIIQKVLNSNIPRESKLPRRHKSLENIARKFLITYINQSECEIKLDYLSKLLDIEKRRIYDIINIFETFNILVKQGKNICI